METQIDAKVETLLSTIKVKREKLGEKPSKALATNGIFKFNERDHININVINDTSKFVELYAYLLNDFKSKEEAAKVLEVTDYNYTFSGFTFKQWERDLKYKIDLIKWNEENKSLAGLEVKLATFISEEKKVANELSQIESLLGA